MNIYIKVIRLFLFCLLLKNGAFSLEAGPSSLFVWMHMSGVMDIPVDGFSPFHWLTHQATSHVWAKPAKLFHILHKQRPLLCCGGRKTPLDGSIFAGCLLLTSGVVTVMWSEGTHEFPRVSEPHIWKLSFTLWVCEPYCKTLCCEGETTINAYANLQQWDRCLCFLNLAVTGF